MSTPLQKSLSENPVYGDTTVVLEALRGEEMGLVYITLQTHFSQVIKAYQNSPRCFLPLVKIMTSGT